MNYHVSGDPDRDAILCELAEADAQIRDARAEGAIEALEQAADALVAYANDVYYRDDSAFHSSQRWALGDTAARWLRERASALRGDA